ncbi:DUF6397 family protein [Streptomyces sp. P6-2-1]|uniref:DUF6397 family protein n=1 Tax=Streptomyces sp. P6-2-1 TaxID=3422591 RepID=UPI003D36C672
MAVRGTATTSAVVGGRPVRGDLFDPEQAAFQLELTCEEVERAAVLGVLPSLPGHGTVPRRFTAGEIERQRASPGFPHALREAVRCVGTAEAAELLGIAPHRFTRLAKLGQFAPIGFHLNRYRAVVWTYPAADVAAWGRRRPELLVGRLPAELRDMTEGDRRAARWRERRRGCLPRLSADPWERAAVLAVQLGPEETAGAADPDECGYLRRLTPAQGTSALTALTRAQGPAERGVVRAHFLRELTQARATRPAPGAGRRARAGAGPENAGMISAPPLARPAPAGSSAPSSTSHPTHHAPAEPLAAAPPGPAVPLAAAPPDPADLPAHAPHAALPGRTSARASSPLSSPEDDGTSQGARGTAPVPGSSASTLPAPEPAPSAPAAPLAASVPARHSPPLQGPDGASPAAGLSAHPGLSRATARVPAAPEPRGASATTSASAPVPGRVPPTSPVAEAAEDPGPWSVAPSLPVQPPPPPPHRCCPYACVPGAASVPPSCCPSLRAEGSGEPGVRGARRRFMPWQRRDGGTERRVCRRTGTGTGTGQGRCRCRCR